MEICPLATTIIQNLHRYAFTTWLLASVCYKVLDPADEINDMKYIYLYNSNPTVNIWQHKWEPFVYKMGQYPDIHLSLIT